MMSISHLKVISSFTVKSTALINNKNYLLLSSKNLYSGIRKFYNNSSQFKPPRNINFFFISTIYFKNKNYSTFLNVEKHILTSQYKKSEIINSLCKISTLNIQKCSKCYIYTQPEPNNTKYDQNKEPKNNVEKYVNKDQKKYENNEEVEDELTILLNTKDNFFVREWKELRCFLWHLIFGSQILVHEAQQAMELKQKRINNIPLSRRESLLVLYSLYRLNYLLKKKLSIILILLIFIFKNIIYEY